MARIYQISMLMLMTLVILAGCQKQPVQEHHVQPVSAGTADGEFTLTTRVGDGRIAYVGVGGEIDGLENPELVVEAGETVRIILINGDGMPHDLSLPDLGVKTPLASGKGKTVEVMVGIPSRAAGSYTYFCTQPGHRQAGQEGVLTVREP